MRERWLEDTVQLLRSAGFHNGGARAALLLTLARTGGGLTAPELHEQVRRSGRPVGAASVYRILTELEGIGAIRRLEIGQSQALFELVDPGGGHHHHIVCDACGRTQTFADPQLEDAIGRIERDASFLVHAHDVILHGLCPRCRPTVSDPFPESKTCSHYGRVASPASLPRVLSPHERRGRVHLSENAGASPSVTGHEGAFMNQDWNHRARRLCRPLSAVAVSAMLVVGLAACGSSSSNSSSSGPATSTAAASTNAASRTSGTSSPIKVVAAENEYGNVASQIGGQYVRVQSVESNPNTDPHTYEVSPGIAQNVSGAQVLVQNGVGYDDWMSKINSASPSSSRQVINVQHVLGLPDSTPNPHLWFAPTTMPKVAAAMAADFAKLRPAHAAYFKANVTKFDASLKPWLAAIAAFKAKYPGTPVATTEPVSDYMLTAMGVDNRTPFSVQADIMNGTDLSPQSVSNQNTLFSGHKVKVFVHNQQVTSPITEGFVKAAKKAGVPIVGVYETMPTPGYTYQTWMLAEVQAIQKAVADKVSTGTL